MRLLSVGVIGYGVVGKRRIQYILQNKRLKLRYVSDVKFKKSFSNKKIVYFKNYLDLIKNKPDIIFVTLPNYLASKVTKLCLKNKIHVFCEKPPGRSVSDIKSVIKQENFDKKIKLKYGFNHRYHGSIRKAKKIIDANGLSEQITLLHGKVEEVELPEGIEKVDIIISEWMGYFLLYESMLDTVLVARDKFLKKGGLLFPDKATLYIAAIEDGEYMNEKIHFWDNVYGFDMSSIKELAYLEPLVDTVESEAVVTNQTKILEVDIETVTKEELDFLGEFKINARRSDYVHAFVAYFDCTFSKCHKPITFSTSPHSEYTHWKQTVFYLQNPIAIGPGEMITGKISCKRNANNPRDLDITIEYNFDGESGKVDEKHDYRLR